MDVYKRSYCRPIETLVDIFQEYPDEIEYIFKPSCVPLMRCGGCCNDEALECVPTSESNITMQVGACGVGDGRGAGGEGGTRRAIRRLSGPLPGKLLIGGAELGFGGEEVRLEVLFYNGEEDGRLSALPCSSSRRFDRVLRFDDLAPSAQQGLVSTTSALLLVWESGRKAFPA